MRLGHPYTVKFYDNEGNIYYSKEFTSGYYVRSFAEEIGNVKMRYGLDSFQVTYKANIYMLSILGNVHSNLDNSNFNEIYMDNAARYSFRVERDGLYAQYINQVRIPDGEYVVETAENSNRVLDILSGFNASVSDYNNEREQQKIKLEYDSTHKAYKIRSNNPNIVLNWQSTLGNNVDYTTDKNYGEQFWYLQNAGNGRHKLINARHTGKSLDLNRSNGNIEVYDSHSDLNQQFKFVKSGDKLGITDSSWKIASKLNNNSLVSVDIGASDPNNVVSWSDFNGNQQRWKFEYNKAKNAYIIRAMHNNQVLAWNDYNNSRNVFVTPFEDKLEYYWVLEALNDGYYIFKNYKDQNMVLDLYESNTTNRSNIQVHERHNGDNQKFKLIR